MLYSEHAMFLATHVNAIKPSVGQNDIGTSLNMVHLYPDVDSNAAQTALIGFKLV